MCLVGLALVAGILWRLLAFPPGLSVAVPALVFAGGFFAKARLGKKKETKLYENIIFAIAILAMLMGYLQCNTEIHLRQSCESFLQDQAEIRLQGRIYKKEIKDQKQRFYLDHVILQTEGDMISTHNTIVTFPDGDYPIGTTITITGVVRLPEPAANDGNYDARSYYHSLNIDYLVQGKEVMGVYGQTDRISEQLYQCKEKLKENYILLFSDGSAGILTTMLLGDKELLDADIKELYQQAGVAHILTISGLHVSLFGMSLYRLLRRKGSFAVAGLGASCVLLLYVNMIGSGISAKRALVMFLLMILGQILGRSYDSLTGLSLAVICLLMENPFLIFHGGFQFSVAAVLGATWVRSSVGKALGKPSRWKKLYEALVASVSIQLMTLPLVAYYYYEIPVYSILLNVVITNLLSVVLMIGFVAGLIGMVSVPVASVLAFPLEYLLQGMTAISRVCLTLPGGVCLVGAISPVRIMVYYAILFLTIQFLVRGRRKNDQRLSGSGECPAGGVRQGTLQPVVLKMWAWPGVGLILMMFLVFYPAGNPMLCAILDVGQGDGIYLQPERGVHIFIDGGSSDVSDLAKYRILPFLKYHRIDHMDDWFVSHYDGDHISGLLQLLEEGYPVTRLFLPYREPENENYIRLVQAAEQAGTQICFFTGGSELQVGDCRIRALLPDESRSVDAGDENENCMVLYVTHPSGNMLFTGDAGTEDEQWILKQAAEDPDLPELSEVKLLKAGHHGSRYSSSEAFLQTLSPEYAVISCGAYNRYGHPHKETIHRLEETNAQIFRTDQAGEVRVILEKDGLGWQVEGIRQYR